MVAPYSGDLRERAMARLDAGESIRSIAKVLSISPSSVSRWTTRRRATGSLAPGKIGGHKRRVLSGERGDWLQARLRSAPFTIRGLHQELAARGIKSSLFAIWCFIHDEGLSYKENNIGEGADAA